MSIQAYMASKGLNSQEAQILELMVKGLGNIEIANMLWMTPATVKYYIPSIYSKLGVKTRAGAIVSCLPHLYPEA